MAIRKMKRLRLMVPLSRKDELLRSLIRLGCVEFTELKDDTAGLELLRRTESEAAQLRADSSALLRAEEVLTRYAGKQKPLLSAPDEVSADELLDRGGIADALALAGEISAADDRIRRIAAEESRERSVIESLEPWLPLDLPLDVDGTERSSVLLGSLSAKIPLDSVREAIAAITEEAELFPVNEDKKASYILIVCAKEALADIQETLRRFGFAAQSFSGMSGPAKQCTVRCEAALASLAREKEACEASIAEKAPRLEELRLAADKTLSALSVAEAADLSLSTQSVAVMQGWFPEENEAALTGTLERFDCAWEFEVPEKEEYPEVPVSLKNNPVTDALNMVTDMYSLPAYGSVDPNPLMAPFFILFYGLMMADIGYGLLMIVAAIVAMRRIKPRGGTLSFCRLLLYCGISTLVMGVLTGGLFGDLPYQLVHMFNPESTWKGLPYLFNPLAEGGAEPVLYGAMVLGVIQLNTGMVINAVKKVRRGQTASAIFEEGSLWVILLGGILYALPALGVLAMPKLPGLIILIVGGLCLLFGAGREAKGFGKVTAAVGCIYSTLTGWFGDILSYSRIMALMLAGSVVGQVFNSIAAMPAKSMGVNVFSILIFLVIFLIGHALNFALNILGCFVHDLRLQCLEYFGKFYEDGGRPFRPLAFKTRFVRAKEN